MRLFESDNIWKKRDRQQRRASRPNAEWEAWKRKRDNCILWLAGIILLVVLYVVAILGGFVTMDMGTIVLLAVISCYCLISVFDLKKLLASEPENKDA